MTPVAITMMRSITMMNILRLRCRRKASQLMLMSLKASKVILHMYDGKSSPNQHIYYFQSQTGNVIDNDAIMARLFIGTLKGIAFDWFRILLSGSINSWIDLETRFLSRLYEDDTKVTMKKLFSTV